MTKLKWKKMDNEIASISGLAGIFDEEHYRNDDDTFYPKWLECADYVHTGREGDRWYGRCAELALDKGNNGILFGGVVCSYRNDAKNFVGAYHSEKNGDITAIKIVYAHDEYTMDVTTDDDERERHRKLDTYYPKPYHDNILYSTQ